MAEYSTPQLTKDDLEELLHSKVESYKCSMLTAPGENYGSTMLLLDVTLLPDHKKASLVAKLVPESPHMRKMFRVEDTVRKEIFVYLLVRPEIYTIQEENNVQEDLFLNVMPKCYGARTTRNGDIDLQVDESAVIILENLKVPGYRLVDRVVGMDLKHTEYVVIRMARFHATALAIKIKKPRLFQDLRRKAAFFVSNSPPPGEKGPIDTVDALLSVPVIAENKDKLKDVLKRGLAVRWSEHPLETREPFATLVHDDLWTNNIMFSYSDGKDGQDISGLKIVDFQSLLYGSPAIDLLFFLFSSTDLSMTSDHCDRLIDLYYQVFTEWLELLGCDTKPISYDIFLNEIKCEALNTFVHVFYMLRIICLAKTQAPDLTKPSELDRVYVDNSGFDELYYMKVNRLVQEFLDRKWI